MFKFLSKPINALIYIVVIKPNNLSLHEQFIIFSVYNTKSTLTQCNSFCSLVAITRGSLYFARGTCLNYIAFLKYVQCVCFCIYRLEENNLKNPV